MSSVLQRLSTKLAAPPPVMSQVVASVIEVAGATASCLYEREISKRWFPAPELLPVALEATGRVPEHAGQETEVHAVSADASRLHIVIIPGNPGMSGYYVPYMAQLSALSPVPLNVSCVTHLGLGSGSRGALTLQDEIQHKAAYLREHVLQPGRPPCVLVGHSIGAFMALEAARLLERDGAGPLKRIVAVCPFLAVDHSSTKQWCIRQLTRAPATLGALAGLIGKLPTSLQRFIVTSYAGKLCDDAISTTLRLLDFHKARNAFFLGSCEFRDLWRPQPDPWELLRAFGERVSVLCAPADVWFPETQREAMRMALPSVQCDLDENQAHAFCVSEQLSKLMAARTLSLMPSVM